MSYVQITLKDLFQTKEKEVCKRLNKTSTRTKAKTRKEGKKWLRVGHGVALPGRQLEDQFYPFGSFLGEGL